MKTRILKAIAYQYGAALKDVEDVYKETGSYDKTIASFYLSARFNMTPYGIVDMLRISRGG